MAYGTLLVDFAGTREEARIFVNAHPKLSLAGHKRDSPEGLPNLSAVYSGEATKISLLQLLAKLGWAQEFVLDVPYPSPCQR